MSEPYSKVTVGRKNRLGLPFLTGKQSFLVTEEDPDAIPNQYGNDKRVVSLMLEKDRKQYYEKLLGNTFTMVTWATNATALRQAWPSIQVSDDTGVFQLKHTQYNIFPMTQGAEMAQGREMSRQETHMEFAMEQFQNNHKYSGARISAPDGPELIRRDLDADAISAQTRADLIRAVGIINAAYYRAIMLNDQESLPVNLAYKMSRDLRVFGGLGTGRVDLRNLINKMRRRNKQLDTLYVTEGNEGYIDRFLQKGGDIPIMYYSSDADSGRQLGINEFVLDKRLQAIGYIGGTEENPSVIVLPFPDFDVPQRKTLRMLESEVVTGEMYNDRTNIDYTRTHNLPYTPAHDSVVILDEPRKMLVEMRAEDALRYAHVWNAKDGGYDSKLISHARDLSRKPKTERWQYPIGDYNGQMLLARLVGNLHDNYLDERMLDQMFIANDAALTVDARQHSENFSRLTDEIQNVEELRKAIESLPYRHEDFEAIARANVQLSAKRTVEDSNFVFSPKIVQTEQGRTTGVVKEWHTDISDTFNIPEDAHPVGMFNAFGLKSLSKSEGHPLKQQAHSAYKFLEALAARFDEVFAGNMITKNREDKIQAVMDVVWGKRAPLYLAVPDAIILQEGVPVENYEITVEQNGKQYTIKVDPSIGGLAKKDAGGKSIVATPEGALVEVDSVEVVQPQTELFLDQVIDTLQTAVPGLMHDDGNYNDYLRGILGKIFSGRTTALRAKYMKYLAYVSTVGDDQKTEKLKDILDTGISSGERQKNLNEAVGDIAEDNNDYTAIKRTITQAFENQHSRLPASQQKLLRERGESYKQLKKRIQEAKAQYTDRGGAQTKFFVAKADVQIDGFTNLATSPNVEEATRDAITQLLDNMDSNMGVIVQPQTADGSQVTVHGLKRAPFYRTKMTMTKQMLDDIYQEEVSWIRPSNPQKYFSVDLDVTDQNEEAYDDATSYHFIANTMTKLGHLRERQDLFFDMYQVALQGNLRSLKEPMNSVCGPMQGKINQRLYAARETYANNWVKRLVAVGTLLLDHQNYKPIVTAMRNGILYPFKPWYLRTQSRHIMADMVLMKRGIESGIVPMSSGHVAIQGDVSNRTIHMRTEVHMTGKALDPNAHELVGPLYPTGYVGGHETTYVKTPEDMKRPRTDVPSVIPVVVSRAETQNLKYPISFLNKVPAEFDSSIENVRPVKPEQLWSGANYYGRKVYGNFFKDGNYEDYTGNLASANKRSFHKEAAKFEHIMFGGFYLQFNPQDKKYNIEKVGNGHRPTRKENMPGACDYWLGASSHVEDYGPGSIQFVDVY